MSFQSLKISIITPSYNQGQYIEQTICSVLDQGYPYLEYIINDAGSTDHTLSIIRKYESQLTEWVSEPDKGQSDAINKGFRKASGTVINWLNSDDYYETDALGHVAKQFEDASVTCYVGKSRIFGLQKEYFSNGTDVYPESLAKTIGWARIDQPETFFRKSVLDEIGLLNESLRYIMDKDLWIRYLCYYGLSGVRKDDRLLVHFRHHEASKSVSLSEKFQQETKNLFYTYAYHFHLSAKPMFESLWDVSVLPLQYFPKGLDLSTWEQVMAYFLLQKGLEAYACNDYKEAHRIFHFVDSGLLHSTDRQELAKIKRRMAFLPISIKKIINRLR